MELTRNERRQLKYVVTTYPYTSYDIVKSMLKYDLKGRDRDKWLKLETAHKLMDKLDLPEGTRDIVWKRYLKEQREVSKQYNLKPIVSRQDNKTSVNEGSGYGGNRNKIRYPKLVRKTAWKRFYKLFPHLKPA